MSVRRVTMIEYTRRNFPRRLRCRHHRQDQFHVISVNFACISPGGMPGSSESRWIPNCLPLKAIFCVVDQTGEIASGQLTDR